MWVHNIQTRINDGLKMKRYLLLTIVLLAGCQAPRKVEQTNSYKLCADRWANYSDKVQIDRELRKRGIDPLSLECGAAASRNSSGGSDDTLQQMQRDRERSRDKREQNMQRLEDRVRTNKPVKTVCRNSFGSVKCTSR
ncbi:hypothetical protein VCRA2123O443_220020 [Vibrio crassostreae]|nr:hypothetical protein VCRA2110O182_220035 [Vibrio crassostreae]CAK2309713.1 hypothetical protein VCRA2111O408_220037 [Vibrio crassostreae]CAK2326072.1 hypothetical protein VCRA211O406_220019 [Vibrio crassostreae]CAK3238857.1 hypothetical protein VCRA2123O443_220020 [Vibrio crassostreae]